MKGIFPDHEAQLARLSRVEGQLKGVRKMIEERRYCVEIVQQIKAISGALKQIEMGVLESHIYHCVGEAVESGDKPQVEEKIAEMVKLFSRFDVE